MKEFEFFFSLTESEQQKTIKRSPRICRAMKNLDRELNSLASPHAYPGNRTEFQMVTPPLKTLE